MKDNDSGLIRRLVIRKLLIKIVLTAVGLFAFLFLADGVLNDFLADLAATTLGSVYYLIRDIKVPLLLAVFLGLVLLYVFQAVGQAARYVDDLVDSIEEVFEEENALIQLPKELSSIETKLNTLKYESVRNEQAAREAEQRKNDLVVYLAHDLKTPLTSVIGYLTLLQDEQQIPEELRNKYLSISLQKAERLEDLINEFFEITRFNLQNVTLEKSRINLSLLLRQLMDEFYPVLPEKNLRIDARIEENLLYYGDADKLARVFDNLLRNAVAYSYENTPITIEAVFRGGEYRVSFTNLGDEIPPQKLERVFEKFFRLDSARTSRTGGAGLGLAIAKQITELHGGRLTAESSRESTVFTVTLPG